MDRKKGRGRERCTICQNNATMLQAAVCLNISVGREGKKMNILKYDRKESMEVKYDIFHFIKKYNVILICCLENRWSYDDSLNKNNIIINWIKLMRKTKDEK